MAIDAVGDIVRVTIAWQYGDGQVLENNIHYRCSVAGTLDSRNLLGSLVYGFFNTSYLGHVSPANSLYGFKADTINRVPHPAPVTGVTINAGTGANPTCPSQARPLLRFQTALTGRKYRGRMFLPSPQGSDVNTLGFPGTTLQVAIAALGAALSTTQVLSGSTWIPCIVHRVPHNPVAATTTDITGYTAPGKFGTQWKSGNTGRLNAAPW